MRSKYILTAALAVGLTTTITTHAEEALHNVDQAQLGSHTVQAGDTLWNIASRNGVSVDQLKAWNGLSNNNIFVGQVLSLTGGSVSTETPVVNNSVQTPAPQEVETPAPTQVSTSGTYTVKSGDSLWSIANAHGISIDDLKRWNNLTSNYIYSGTQFVVNAPSGATQSPTPAPSPSSTPTVNSSSGTYTAVAGDYLYKIANDHGITLDELRRLNNLTSDMVRVGQTFRVSGSATTPSVAPSAKPSVNNGGSSAGVYTAVAGDYLYKIANDHGITLAELRRLNNLTSDMVRVGQQFVVSSSTSSAPVQSQRVVKPTEENKGNTATSSPNLTHTVVPGDTLYRIATRNGMTVSQLKQLNNMSGDVLAVGRVLKLDKQAASTPSTQKPVTPARPNNSNGSGLTPSRTHNINNPYVHDVPDLSQLDDRWANSTYGNDVSKSIWENGCAVVSLAMVDSYYKGEITDPTEIADWAGLDHYLYGVGSTWTIFDAFAEDFGYNMVNHGSNYRSAMNAVQNGDIGVVSVQPGHFINGGHIMAIKGYDPVKDQVWVNDPHDNSRDNNSRGHDSWKMMEDGKGFWTFSLK